MSVRIRLLGLAGPPRATTIDGWYLVSCNVNENNGRGSIVASPDPTEAIVFADAVEATAYYQRQSDRYPVRADGQPNKPLTKYDVMIEPVMGERGRVHPFDREERTHAQDKGQDAQGHPESGSSPDS